LVRFGTSLSSLGDVGRPEQDSVQGPATVNEARRNAAAGGRVRHAYTSYGEVSPSSPPFRKERSNSGLPYGREPNVPVVEPPLPCGAPSASCSCHTSGSPQPSDLLFPSDDCVLHVRFLFKISASCQSPFSCLLLHLAVSSANGYLPTFVRWFSSLAEVANF
jgi:hypothetical protein